MSLPNVKLRTVIVECLLVGASLMPGLALARGQATGNGGETCPGGGIMDGSIGCYDVRTAGCEPLLLVIPLGNGKSADVVVVEAGVPRRYIADLTRTFEGCCRSHPTGCGCDPSAQWEILGLIFSSGRSAELQFFNNLKDGSGRLQLPNQAPIQLRCEKRY